MAAADDLRDLSDRVQADLDSAAEFYLNTRRAWRLIQQLVAEGRQFAIVNGAAETLADQQTVDGLAERYVTMDLRSTVLERFVSSLEDFVLNLFRLWLLEFPGILSARTLTLRDVLDLDDKDAIIARFVDNEVRGFGYKRPDDWFQEINKHARLGCPSEDEVQVVCEIKATRDILTHNRGVVNHVYRLKAGDRARFNEGEIIDIPDDYLLQSLTSIKTIVQTMTNAAMAKLRP
jgi:hypothetical protein